MRIGIDGRGYHGSLDGIGRYSRNLINSLLEVDRNNEYVIFIRPGTDWSFLSEYQNARVFEFPYSHLSLATIYKLGPLVDREGVDVYHSLFFVAPRKMKARLILTVHDLMALNFPGFFGERFILSQMMASLYHKIYVPGSIQRADAIIAVSEFTRKQMMDLLNVPGEKVSLVYNVVAPRFTHEGDEEADKAVLNEYNLQPGYLLYVGNTKPYKNVEGLFRGYARYRIKSQDSSAPLVLAGKPDRFRKRVDRVAQTLRIQDKVRYLNEVSDKNLPALMRGALALIQPSHIEGFGLPALEALACGTPVIASQASALSEVLGRSALLFPSDDTTKLGECINRLEKNPKLRDNLSSIGIERAERFRKANVARQLLQVYQKAAKAKGKEE